MIDPKIEKSAMKTKNAIMNKIISAGIEATANLIRKDTKDPNGISKSVIFTG